MSEFVYILTNPTIPDLVKIGRIKNLEERIRSLSSHSGVPVPFQCFYCCEVKDGSEVEKRLHFGLGDHRINSKREFFRINPERVKVLLEGWSIRDVTPSSDIVDSQEEQDSLNRETSRRPMFTFQMVDIPVGSELTFLKDKTKVSIVSGVREVEYENVKYSLNQVTMELLTTEFSKN